jgi:hypothetical protein
VVPNDQPPVAVSRLRLTSHPARPPVEFSDAQLPLDFTLECIPLEVCSEHSLEFLRDYERPLSKNDMTHLQGAFKDWEHLKADPPLPPA